MNDPFVLAAVGAAVAALAWFQPFAAAAFVAVGSAVFYAALDLGGLGTSAQLAGVAFGGVGSVALLRLLLRARWTRGRMLAGALFLAFVILWLLRWRQEPPTAVQGQEFAGRARGFVYAFATVPFLCGLLVRDLTEVRRLLRWVATWSLLALALVGGAWLAGMPDQSGIEDRWQPFASLSPIFLGIDLGFGALVASALLSRRPGFVWTATRVVILAVTGALVVAIGERGPFLFFLVGVAAAAALQRAHSRGPLLLLAAGAVAGVGWLLLSGAGAGTELRILDADRYTADANVDRLSILRTTFTIIPMRPLLGWGGSLAGRPVGYIVWDYSHQLLLDPLVETGVVGALLVWGLFGVLAAGVVRSLRARGAAAEAVRLFLPAWIYVFLESQVSSHISTTRELWLATGVLLALTEVARAAERRAKAGAEVEPPASAPEPEHRLAHAPALAARAGASPGP